MNVKKITLTICILSQAVLILERIALETERGYVVGILALGSSKYPENNFVYFTLINLFVSLAVVRGVSWRPGVQIGLWTFSLSLFICSLPLIGSLFALIGSLFEFLGTIPEYISANSSPVLCCVTPLGVVIVVLLLVIAAKK